MDPRGQSDVNEKCPINEKADDKADNEVDEKAHLQRSGLKQKA